MREEDLPCLRLDACLRSRHDSLARVPGVEIAGHIDGKPIRLGLDTLAGLSCVGKCDLTPDERKRCVPTSERLHQAGGDALRSDSEIELHKEIAVLMDALRLASLKLHRQTLRKILHYKSGKLVRTF